MGTFCESCGKETKKLYYIYCDYCADFTYRACHSCMAQSKIPYELLMTLLIGEPLDITPKLTDLERKNIYEQLENLGKDKGFIEQEITRCTEEWNKYQQEQERL